MELSGVKRNRQMLPDSQDQLLPLLSKMTAGDAPIAMKQMINGEIKEVEAYNFYDKVATPATVVPNTPSLTYDKIYTNNWTTALEINLKSLTYLKTNNILGGSVLEIGCYEGAGTELLHKYLHPSEQVCCDPWEDSYTDVGFTFKNQYENFKSNTKHLNITEMRMTSDKMFSELDIITFDFIYIDGDHSYEQVVKDLNNSFKVLKVGGIILLDDYGWESVRRAVNEFYNANLSSALRLCLDCDYQFAFTKTK